MKVEDKKKSGTFKHEHFITLVLATDESLEVKTVVEHSIFEFDSIKLQFMGIAHDFSL